MEAVGARGRPERGGGRNDGAVVAVGAVAWMVLMYAARLRIAGYRFRCTEGGSGRGCRCGYGEALSLGL